MMQTTKVLPNVIETMTQRGMVWIRMKYTSIRKCRALTNTCRDLTAVSLRSGNEECGGIIQQKLLLLPVGTSAYFGLSTGHLCKECLDRTKQ